MLKRRLLCAGFSFKILFLCCTTNCQAQNNSFCVPSSCGDISIRYLFRLKAGPKNCGHPEPIFMLECQKNRTILSSKLQRYNVHAINYNNFTIRIADPGLYRDNYSSCPIYSYVVYDLSSSYMYLASSQSITLLNCISPINNLVYIENPFCGNKRAFSNSSKILSYFVIGNILGSDLEESCTFDTMVLTSSGIPLQENATYSTIHNALAFGFELSWYRVMCGECDASKGTCIVEDNQIRCRHYYYEDTPPSERSLRCSKQALVYEFMPNGSLDKYVYSQEGTVSLSYRNMFKISLGMARGINYLHQDFEHIDIKLHNILLDENLNPKISDLDLAKLYLLDDIGGVSYKADLYNFGMMLMEMARRRENMNPFAKNLSQVYFPSWVYDQLNEGKELEMGDATEEERKMMIVALWCIQMRLEDRPSTNKVVEMLEADIGILRMPPKSFPITGDMAKDDKYTARVEESV
ncbi:Rust resistance kinase Lr10 [Abeliophyllum distichum]|uniref:non-specific serine/threonine protein kinase n=1 Tax=Abeliophyllum distichum TaxID=126358 RepID=A0ABD1URU2_9LAMI